MKKEIADAITGAIQALQRVATAHPDSSEHSRDMYEAVMDARMGLLKLRPFYEESDCPGHTASMTNAKVCEHCGVHVDVMR